MVGRFRFPVIGCELRHAVTSRFLWLAPHKNEILDIDTSKLSLRVSKLSLRSNPCHNTSLIAIVLLWLLLFMADCDGTVVKVLCYKSEGRWFDLSWCH